MPFVGEAMIHVDTYKAAVRKFHRGILIGARVIGFLPIALIVTTTAADLARGTFAVLDLPLIGLLIMVGAVFAFVVPRRLVNKAVAQNAVALSAPWRYEIDDTGIQMTTALATGNWPWQSLTAVEDLPDYLLLHTATKGQYLMVLKDAFSEPDQQRILRLCQEKIAASRLSHPPLVK